MSIVSSGVRALDAYKDTPPQSTPPEAKYMAGALVILGIILIIVMSQIDADSFWIIFGYSVGGVCIFLGCLTGVSLLLPEEKD